MVIPRAGKHGSSSETKIHLDEQQETKLKEANNIVVQNDLILL
jgi:hypothetical protein